MGRTARRHQLGRIHRLGGGIPRRNFAVPALPADVKRYVQPAALYSFIAGFVVYAALAKAGLEPKVVEMPVAKKAA